jgi:membrane protein DedA with SNARE-associated domain
MPWWRFFAWNALGGVVWAFGVGLVAYYVGKAAADALARYGVYGGIAVAVLVALAIAGVHVWRRTAGSEA